MDSHSAATHAADPAAVEFVRFCYHRRRVGWPELYDEMCAVAGRSLFRGYDADDLAGIGIGFSLFGMPALSVLAGRVIAEEQALRRPVSVVLTPEVVRADDASAVLGSDRAPAEVESAIVRAGVVAPSPALSTGERTIDVPIRFAVVPAGA